MPTWVYYTWAEPKSRWQSVGELSNGFGPTPKLITAASLTGSRSVSAVRYAMSTPTSATPRIFSFICAGCGIFATTYGAWRSIPTVTKNMHHASSARAHSSEHRRRHSSCHRRIRSNSTLASPAGYCAGTHNPICAANCRCSCARVLRRVSA
jgi:hypothetical protein